MKKVIKRMFPICLAAIILCQTVYSSVDVARASGVEQMLYYTYWDLITSIYSVCGYESKTDVSVANNHGVTGKQAWDNFVTFVENSAKANYKFVGDGMSKAFSELENIVNTATEKGISMTQNLYDMLKSVFADQVTYSSAKNQFDVSSIDKIESQLRAWTGVTDDYENVSILNNLASSVYSGAVLNILEQDGLYMCFLCEKPLYVDVQDNNHSFPLQYYDEKGDFLNTYVWNIFSSTKRVSGGISGVSVGSGYYWVVKGGSFIGTDVIGAQVSAVARSEEHTSELQSQR